MNSRSLNKSLTTETCIHLTITTQPFRKSWTRLTSWHLFKFSSALLLQEAHMCFLLIYNEGGISFNKDRENSNEDKRNIFCSRISRNTGIFFKLRHHFSPSQLRQIYYNLFCPHLSYAMIAWSSAYKSNQKALRVETCNSRSMLVNIHFYHIWKPQWKISIFNKMAATHHHAKVLSLEFCILRLKIHR